MSVSSSVREIVSTQCSRAKITGQYRAQHTPRLDIKSDDRLGGDLGLEVLLGLVSGQTLVTDTGSLGILLLVVAAEEIDILIIILLGGGGLGGVERHLGYLRSVYRVGLAGVTRERGELILVRGDVLVPTGSVGVLLGVGGGLEGLEDGDIGLRGGVSEGRADVSVRGRQGDEARKRGVGEIRGQRYTSAGFVIICSS